MAGVNKVIILGRLGNDPEMRTFPNGDQIAIINVATSEKWQDKQSGELKENTEWHRIIFYRRLAEITGKYLKKGSKVYLEGKLKTRKWQDEKGQERQTKEIQGESLQLLDTKPEQTSTSSINAYQQAKNGNYIQNATSDQAFKDDIPF